jgi:hypothetical protein
VGSDQTSKAVGSLVSATQTAGQIGNTATTAAQQGVLGAGQTAVSNLQPYTSVGTTAANSLNADLSPGGSLTSKFSFDPTQIANNPDYQFQLQQGLQAVKQAAAATGTLGSSQTLKGLTNYAGGLASSEIGQAYNQALSTYQTNYGNTLNSLGLGLNTGLNATTSANNALIGTNQIAGNYGVGNAQNQEQLALDAGQAKASGSIQQGNIWGGLAGNVGTGLWNATPNLPGGPGITNVIGAAVGLG